MNKIDLTLIEKKPEKSVIDHLEALLVQARSGELQELCYVCGFKEGSVNHGWTKLNNNRRLVGEIEFMKHAIMETAKR